MNKILKEDNAELIYKVGIKFPKMQTEKVGLRLAEIGDERYIISYLKNIKLTNNVPLEKDLQIYIIRLCESYNIDPALVMAIIYRESRFQADVIGDHGNSFGLMQIQPKWHQWRMDELGCDNLLDPYQNVAVGLHLLNELYSRGKSTEWVLMAYNGGPSYANKMEAKGELSGYAERALADYERYKTERTVIDG